MINECFVFSLNSSKVYQRPWQTEQTQKLIKELSTSGVNQSTIILFLLLAGNAASSDLGRDYVSRDHWSGERRLHIGRQLCPHGDTAGGWSYSVIGYDLFVLVRFF